MSKSEKKLLEERNILFNLVSSIKEQKIGEGAEYTVLNSDEWDNLTDSIYEICELLGLEEVE